MTASTATRPLTAGDKIVCQICGAHVHSIALHMKEHPGVTLEQYQVDYPGAPVLSPLAEQRLKERAAAAAAAVAPTASTPASQPAAVEKQSFHETFGLPATPSTLSSKGKPIPITILAPTGEAEQMVPALDPDYVFEVDILKTMMMAIEMRIPCYLWGHAGTGKTSMYYQIAARTRRPVIRINHTANMEEDQVVGGWRVRDGSTFFELGPLALAMKHGWTCILDEYDFGRPEVLALYQAVLEGGNLFIKEADPENRLIKPDPNFRILATGNTNGQGDESGLYAGTNMQNAANFERFGVVQQMPWMKPDLEARVISRKARIPVNDAAKLVEFATAVRTEFDGAKMSNPISPRSLIYAARLGNAREDYKTGLQLAFINRLTAVDREAATQLAQRVFGK